jgi:hypothetical protein
VKAVAVLVILLLAGCAGETKKEPRPVELESWTPLPCDQATQISRSARMVPGLTGDADTVAARIGQAFNDPVTGPMEPYEDSPLHQWPTAKGRIVVQMSDLIDPDGELYFIAALYMREGTIGVADVLAAAKSLGADAATVKSSVTGRSGAVWQEWLGSRLEWLPWGKAGATFGPSEKEMRVDLGPFYEFLADEVKVTASQASSRAQTFLRCHLDAAGNTADKGYRLETPKVMGLTVVESSLSYLVNIHHSTPKYSPCGSWDARWIFVDAVTGAVVQNKLGPCV